MEIYGTLGPSVDDEEILRQMFACGMTGMRLNLSHTTLEKSQSIIGKFHATAQKEGVKADLMIDLQGPEMRIRIWDGSRNVLLGKQYTMTAFQGESPSIRYGSDVIYAPLEIVQAAEIGDSILVDDGKVSFTVTNKIPSNADFGAAGLSMMVSCESPGMIQSNKSIAVKNKAVTGNVLTKMDRENLQNSQKFGVTSIMQPFVRNAEDLIAVHDAIKEFHCGSLRLFAKIENTDGVSKLPEIISHCDMIVIARGDLGNAYPLWDLPVIQRRISEICNDKCHPFLVVTQMLSSMESHPYPTRAEVSDIFRAVTEGASAVMVTGETAAGKYPVEVMRYLVNTVKSAQKWMCS